MLKDETSLLFRGGEASLPGEREGKWKGTRKEATVSEKGVSSGSIAGRGGGHKGKMQARRRWYADWKRGNALACRSKKDGGGK